MTVALIDSGVCGKTVEVALALDVVDPDAAGALDEVCMDSEISTLPSQVIASWVSSHTDGGNRRVVDSREWESRLTAPCQSIIPRDFF
jgi:hypothetical protein